MQSLPNRRALVMYLTGPLIGILAGGVLTAIIVIRHRQAVREATEPKQLNFRPEIVIGVPHGSHDNGPFGYVLVEFGDYQCPPCIALSHRIPSVVGQYEGRLSFLFRNYPLSQIHRDAFRLAKVAEAARMQGHFSEMHDALFRSNGNVSEQQVNRLVASLQLDRERFLRDFGTAAEQTVRFDTEAARALDLPGTSSLLLCCPDRKVFLLRSLDQIGTYLGRPTQGASR